MRRRGIGPGVLLCLALGGFAGLATSACTLLGALSGAVIKTPDRSRMRSIAPWQLVTAKKGAWLDLRLRDGRGGGGTFSGLEDRKAPEYAHAYDLATQSLQGESSLPALGPGARLQTRSGAGNGGPETLALGVDCDLLGFDYGQVQCAGPRSKTRPFALADVARISDRGGRGISGDALASLISAGQVPVRQRLLLSVSDKEMRDRLAGGPGHVDEDGRIPILLESIAEIEVSALKGNALMGALVGAVIDGTLIAIVLSQDPIEVDTGGGQSCPFVYSYDGEGYVLDAEPFGGSFTEVAQRTAWSRLDHLREVDGSYRLRITDELEETEHLDEVKLLVVDHPPGAIVAADLLGGVHAVAGPVPPRSAKDLRGADVLDLVAGDDERGWLGYPFGRDPAREANLHDGLLLEFPRPQGVSSATLILKARSTPWFPRLFHRVLTLPGRERDAFYARLASDPLAGVALLSFAAEAFPGIRLWDGHGWSPAGLLGELPTVAWGAQAVRLDLTNVPREAVKLRLEGLPGTWRLDDAAMGFGAEPPIDVVELSAAVARTVDGLDVRDELKERDKIRRQLRKGDALEIEFTAPRSRPGRERSFLLKAAGYYTIVFANDGEPEMARFEALLHERGALARFAAEEARDTLRLALAEAR